MVMPATNNNTQTLEETEEPEDFEVLIDEPHLAVVRVGDLIAAEVHTPVDLTELGFQLAQEGYAIMELLAFHDGVIEMALRRLGDIPVDDPVMEKRLATIKELADEREEIYA